MGPGKRPRLKGSSPDAMALKLCCGTIVRLTRDALVSRMNPLVHFVAIVRGRGCEGSSTPGEQHVDSEDPIAYSVLQAALSRRCR